MNTSRISAILALLTALGFAETGGAQYAPNGWIQGQAWNILLPLGNPHGCTAGGQERPLENWTEPHDVRIENPVAGTTWDIDFSGTRASGWGGQFIAPQPTWITEAYLEERFADVPGFIPTPLEGNDIVDAEAFLSHVTAFLIPDIDPTGTLPLPPRENVFYVATTYVQNMTEAMLPLEVCASGDDAYRVWHRGADSIVWSFCSGVAPSCDELHELSLPPGVSKIAVTVWQGGVAWGHRLGLRYQGELLDDSSGLVRFLGPNPGAPAPSPLVIDRHVEAIDGSLCGPRAGDNGARVWLNELLTESSASTGAEPRLVTEDVLVPAGFEAPTVSNTSPPADVSEVFSPSGELERIRITWDVLREEIVNGLSYELRVSRPGNYSFEGSALSADAQDKSVVSGERLARFAQESTGIWDGVFSTSGSVDLTFDGSTYTQTGLGYDIWVDSDDFSYAYKDVEGDFALEMRVTQRTPPETGGRWGKHGLMARYGCETDAGFHFLQTNLASTGEIIDEPRHSQRFRDRSPSSTWEPYFVQDGFFPLESRSPSWMRIERRGNAIFSFLSEDSGGSPARWVPIGVTTDAQMPDRILAGVALTPHAELPASISYDHVRLEALAPLVFPPVCGSSGTPRVIAFDSSEGAAPAGATVVSSGGFSPRVVGGRLRLTEDGTAYTANAVWYRADQDDLTTSGFVAEFDAFFTPKSGPSADGITFAAIEVGGTGNPFGAFPRDLDLATLVGDTGGSLGFARGAIADRAEGHPGFCVELDSWQGGARDDPSGTNCESCAVPWHIGVDAAGDSSSIITNVDWGMPGLPRFDAPAGNRLRVSYLTGPYDDSLDGLVAVDISANDGSFPWTRILEAPVARLSGEIVFGFTGGTGAVTATAEVDNLTIEATTCTDCPSEVAIEGPSTIALGATASFVATLPLPIPMPVYHWAVISGPSEIVSGAEGAIVDLRSDLPGESVLQLSVEVSGCQTLVSEHSVSVTCPSEVTIEGPSTIAVGAMASFVAALPLPIPMPAYHWAVISGPAEIISGAEGAIVDLRSDLPGESVLQLSVEVSGCQTLVSELDVSTSCPGIGDTHCTALDVIPAEGVDGDTTLVASGIDDSGDAVFYSFVLIGPGDFTARAGPQLSPTLRARLFEGDWEVRVEVDDDLACDDLAPDATRTRLFQVSGLTGLQRPGDCNQDGVLDISDAICLFGHLFLGDPSTLPCNTDAARLALSDWQPDGTLDLSDGVAIIAYLFLGGPPHPLGQSCRSIPGCPQGPGCP